MTAFIDNDPDPAFPYTIFDRVTGEIIDRCTAEGVHVARSVGDVVLRTA